MRTRLLVPAFLLPVLLLALFVTADDPTTAPTTQDGSDPAATNHADYVIPKDTLIGHNVEYAKNGIPSQSFDLYLPANAPRPCPLIIWIHGGNWCSENKDALNPATAFLVKDYAVASINYRYSSQAVFPAQLYDVKAAIRYLRANAQRYNIDPDHFAVWGPAAGGHLAALAGLTSGNPDLEGDVGTQGVSSAVQAVVEWFAPVDFLTLNTQEGANVIVDHNDQDSPESRLIGGALLQNVAKAKAASPITYVKKGAPPFLIMHGKLDTDIPIQQSQELADALTKVGTVAEFIPIADAGHGGRVFVTEGRLGMIESFLDKYMRP